MKITLLLSVLVLSAGLAGCGQDVSNTDWATNLSADTNGSGTTEEIQAALDAYAGALVNKDRDAFLAVVDTENAAFTSEQDLLYNNLADVPFLEYSIKVTSNAETGPDAAVVKVDIASTYTGGFDDLPDPQRAAYYMVKKESGWKLSGDATVEALGKKREAGLESYGKVIVTEGQHVIVLSHEAQAGLAAEVMEISDAAYPRLRETLPGLDMPKVPIKLFDSMSQIEAAYPGGWQEWTGGASKPLGSFEGQGGEIIIDVETFQETGSYNDGYNNRMLGHELTHVALFPKSGVKTPSFLVEGLADYVGGYEPVILLRQKMRSGEPFSPTLSDLYEPTGFSTLLTTEAATLAYEESDLAVEYLVSAYGNDAVLELLKEFKDRSQETIDQDELVNEIFLDVLGTSWADFESSWRDYVLQG